MNYKNISYPHSYLIYKDNINTSKLKDYNTVSLFEFNVCYSDTYSVTFLDKGNIKYLMLGYSLDIRDGTKSDLDILEMLHQSDTVVEDLEYIAGRYIYIKAVRNEMFIYSDANQLLPLVFNKEAEALSSHDNLLAEVLIENDIKLTRRPLEVHNELDFTRYIEIQKFNPSMRLRTKDFSYRRIYPREELSIESIDSIFNQIKPYLEEMKKWLKLNNQEKFVTITGGIDSRVSASLTRDIEGIEYLTYFMPDKYIRTPLAKSIYAVDRTITRQMKDNLKWKHEIVDLSKIPLSKEELEFYKEYYNSKHGYRIDKYYREYKKHKNVLHIKSNVFGMGKADFSPSFDKISNTMDYLKKSVRGFGKGFEKFYDKDKEIMSYFNRNLVDTSISKGRHYFDIFYLESRMGNWLSALTLETDPEVEEFIFINSRKLIDLIQSVSLSDRRNFSLYKKIIEDNWPILLYFGINKEESLFQQTNSLQETIASNMTIYSAYSLTVKKLRETISISPASQHIRLSENYYFIIKNEKNDLEDVVISSDYSNESARGSIRILIRSEGNVEEFDILDLNNGLNLNRYGSLVHINIIFNKEYDADSWRKSATLNIKY
ncbi:hypothetical protein [Aliicoccus persicus]|uniref:Asparagine synthase n=1 Tax=Aliicoccus persicus TaxID=930138 RepID=A0A662Z2C4_9STAP|nr:hypothetical protein [Aliicoccus persicus]SEV79770.1 hypothetical protein SAMN05192557_0022 [Aliicoccus persicus]